MTPEDQKELDAMEHLDMARLLRFAPAGNKWFDYGERGVAFQKKFQELGGMTPEISKLIG